MTLAAAFILVQAPPKLAIRVDGEGYLRLVQPSRTVYAKQVELGSASGYLATADGSILAPKINVPKSAIRLSCKLTGEILAVFSDQPPQAIGRVVLAEFPPGAKMTPSGGFSLCPAPPRLANPGEGLSGVIRLVLPGQELPSPPLKAAKTSKPAPATSGHSFAPATAQVQVHSESEVDAEFIRLGGIAKLSGDPALIAKLKQIDLGRAPVMGTRRAITPLHLRAQIASSGIDIRKVQLDVPVGATVTRAAQRVPFEAIQQVVDEQVRLQLGAAITLSPKTRFSGASVRKGELKIQVTNLDLRESEVIANVDLLVEGELSQSLRLTYAASGLTLVRRGETVRLRVMSNAAQVEVSAKTKSQAFVGQMVTVETSTGTQHSGKLLPGNIVEVRL